MPSDFGNKLVVDVVLLILHDSWLRFKLKPLGGAFFLSLALLPARVIATPLATPAVAGQPFLARPATRVPRGTRPWRNLGQNVNVAAS